MDEVESRTVPVSLKCAAYEYLIPALAYIQSTMFPEALMRKKGILAQVSYNSNFLYRYNVEQRVPVWHNK